MPIYEYRCDTCGHQEDHLQKVSEKPLTKCPACGKKTYKKQLSAAGFQLKGSGWYATDFKTTGKKPEKTEKKVEAKSDAKSESKTEPKTDSKTDSKTETKKAAAPAVTD
jgi:putative FmdB family regulatory protein